MLKFQLVSIRGSKYDDEAYEILVPTPAGTIGLFEHHMPMISAASPGVLSVRRKQSDPDSAMQSFAVNGGLVEIDGKTVRFIADDVSTPDEISEQEAAQALARAEKMVAEADSQTELHEAHRRLHHSSARLAVAKLKRRHHN